MNFEDVIKTRFSVRKYTTEVISKEDLNKILEAGRIAPTAKNRQPQKIYVVQSQEGLEKIDKVSPCRYGATTVLLVCADKNIAWSRGDYSSYEMDASIVATHMMLEATNIGVGNLWVRLLDIEKTKEEFNLPENIVPVCLIPLGYKADNCPVSPLHYQRKELAELVEYV